VHLRHPQRPEVQVDLGYQVVLALPGLQWLLELRLLRVGQAAQDFQNYQKGLEIHGVLRLLELQLVLEDPVVLETLLVHLDQVVLWLQAVPGLH
jgi:hypothetical protein